MNDVAIRQLEPKLAQFLNSFGHCLSVDAFAHLTTYVEGQRSEIERKNVERIALNAGVVPRTLQEFLASHEWEHDEARATLQRIIAREHQGESSVGIIDETSFIK